MTRWIGRTEHLKVSHQADELPVDIDHRQMSLLVSLHHLGTLVQGRVWPNRGDWGGHGL
jgi:hypothetical protein